MDNTNTTMKVKFSELQGWIYDGSVEFDVPGVLVAVGTENSRAAVGLDGLDVMRRRRLKLAMLGSGLAKLAGECMRDNPQACAAVAEWDALCYCGKRLDEQLEKPENALEKLEKQEGGEV